MGHKGAAGFVVCAALCRCLEGSKMLVKALRKCSPTLYFFIWCSRFSEYDTPAYDIEPLPDFDHLGREGKISCTLQHLLKTLISWVLSLGTPTMIMIQYHRRRLVQIIGETRGPDNWR